MSATRFVLVLTALLIAAHVTAPAAQAQTTYEIRQRTDREYQAADKKLNAEYQLLLRSLNKAFQQRLLAAQLAWIAVRDLDPALMAEILRAESWGVIEKQAILTRSTESRAADLAKLAKGFGS